jgi:DNA helicase-2/ATP-dependent DNA helicase PcrA
MNQLFKGLNDEQVEVVSTTEGAIQVVASAGSGKTTSVVKRIVYMIENGIDPSSILMNTFTKKAAEEMKERLKHLLPVYVLKQLTIGTTHSVCYKILANELENVNHPYAYALRDKNGILSDNALKLFGNMVIDSMIKKRPKDDPELNILSGISLGEFFHVVSLSKNAMVNCNQFNGEEWDVEKGKFYEEFYKMYEDKKLLERKMDLDDLLLMTYDLFVENPNVLKQYQYKFQYIVVDENQDSNQIQNALMKMLAYPQNNICVVGDHRQSIYGFRGATVDDFINFKHDYPDAKSIDLKINYRSNPDIIHRSNQLIKFNSALSVDAIPFKQNKNKCVDYNSFYDGNEEATHVSELIRKIVDEEKIQYKDCAVLYRTNAQSKYIEDQLIANGVPYVIQNGFSFYQRKEILDVLSYIRLALNKNDDTSFRRVINTPSRYLGKAFMSKIDACRCSHFDALDRIVLKPFEKRNVDEFEDLVNRIRKMIVGKKVNGSVLIEFILKYGRYEDEIKRSTSADNDLDRMENLVALGEMINQFETIEKFLNYIDMMASKRKDSINGVQLMSIHRSKGLEFSYVFLIGVSEGLLPHQRSIDNDDIEEERRLMYVGMTRAIDYLHISSIMNYNKKALEISRFIKECGFDN